MKKRALMISLLVLAALLTVPANASATTLTWRLLPTGTDAQFRGLSAVNRHVAWVSGTRGTVLRTVDGGRTWQQVGPPGTATLDFRDIEAFDANTAVALAGTVRSAARTSREIISARFFMAGQTSPECPPRE
jgi:photosystem II stability/assembly factor-like uncharacterized protein